MTHSTKWQAAFNRRLCSLAFTEYQQQKAAHLKKRRSIRTLRYVVPQWQADAIEAMAENDEEKAKAVVLFR